MEYFISHLGKTTIAAIVIAVIALIWWYLLEINARLKRQRAQVRKEASIRSAEKRNMTDNK
ncbi:MAG TPA: hypothetical protein GX736_04475 [Mogibacterium sp.]|nr:hypothetical protein [Mogibacterium sp.]